MRCSPSSLSLSESFLLLLSTVPAFCEQPLASRCSLLPSATNVACVNNYAAVLPYPFSRVQAETLDQLVNDTFRLTNVPSDPSFDEYITNSPFIVFEEERGSQILGPNPELSVVFSTRSDSIHEAPVYVPELQSIIYSLPHQGIYEQQLINLTDPKNPVLVNYTTSPPVYAVNGGKYYQGQVYWAVEGGLPFPDPSDPSKTIQQAPGIYRLDPKTGKVETLVNNYYGTLLNSPNDIWVDQAGDVWFTDGWYGYAINVTSTTPPNEPRTYRFRPSNGRLSEVENSISQPNGIAFSPDGRTCFISDTGITDFQRPPPDNELPRYGYNRYGGDSLYAFDVQYSPAGNYLINKRPIWAAQEFAEDGLHVSREGYIIGAAGFGVDILSEYGEYLVRIYTKFPVNNIQFAGEDRSDLWIFGMGGIARVKWNLKGMLQE